MVGCTDTDNSGSFKCSLNHSHYGLCSAFRSVGSSNTTAPWPIDRLWEVTYLPTSDLGLPGPLIAVIPVIADGVTSLPFSFFRRSLRTLSRFSSSSEVVASSEESTGPTTERGGGVKKGGGPEAVACPPEYGGITYMVSTVTHFAHEKGKREEIRTTYDGKRRSCSHGVTEEWKGRMEGESWDL